jgi:predicted phosphodiesterase
MNIRLVSDLHINFSSVEIPFGGVDVLVLAGDMSPSPEQTADWIARRVPEGLKTLYVPGNHEYEGHYINTHTQKMRAALAEFPHVKLLQNDVHVHEGVRFLGTTLWTDFAAFPQFGSIQDAMQRARYGISDFSTIRVKEEASTRPFEPEDAKNEFRSARRFLSSTLAQPFDGKTVVISHFLPSPRCVHPQYAGSPMNAYFACNVESLMEGVDVWMHGHTHSSVDLEIGNTRVVCNPRGYSRQFNLSENQAWDPTKDVVLPSEFVHDSQKSPKP